MKRTKKTETTLVQGGGVVLPMNKLFLYFAIAAITFLFGGLIAAFFYSGIQKGFQKFSLPSIFHANTIIMLASSLTMHFAVSALKRDEMQQYRYAIGITFLLGISFVVFQFLGWYELTSAGIKLNSLPTGSYLYMISGLHALHFIPGIVILGISLAKAIIRNYNPVDELLFSVDANKKLKIELIATYWHFVDILWLLIYTLFVSHLYL
jgi:cytochrome c oxidase subunit III